MIETSCPLTAPFEEPQEVTEAVTVDLCERSHPALQEFLSPELGRHAPELRIAVGHPFAQIPETARHDTVDLIVMGTHGCTGWGM
jgi:nucleotide-binding universal stress UspA family protein